MANPSLLIIPDRYKAAKLYSQLPESGAGDFTVTRGTTAYRTNASGLLESVASGVPRLDYTGGGCPSLLVEPAATNLALRSEEFNDASWVKVTTTISANSEISPNGTLTADTMEISAGGSRIQQAVVLGSGNYTFSIYAKGITGSGNMNIQLVVDGVSVDNIINITNEWKRFVVTVSATTSLTSVLFRRADFTVPGQVAIWGAQLEVGSVATSYIPTVASTVTRNADVISLSSVSGLIGQQEGYIYAEVDITRLGTTGVALKIGSATNFVALSKLNTNRLEGAVIGSLASVIIRTTISSLVAGVYKMAIAYAQDDFVFYVNGVNIGSSSSGTPSANFSQIDLGIFGTSSSFNDSISAAAIGTTRPSNAELAAMTTL